MVGRKINQKGRSREPRHVRLYAYMTSSAAWLDLSGNAVKLLVFLAAWEDGTNNGEFFMSWRDAAAGIGVSKRTAGKLFDELEAHGFIVPIAKGYFTVKHGPATKWRLTWVPWASRGPTNEWRAWKPEENSRAQLLHETGAKITPITTARRTTGAEIAPVTRHSAETAGAESNPHSVAIGEVNAAPRFQANSPFQNPSGHCRPLSDF
jgi:hypothetical protein